MKPARWQSDCCSNIDSAVPVKISNCSKLGRIADAVALMWPQAAVRICKKYGHIIRCVVQYYEIGRPIAIDLTSVEIIADPEIFQHTCAGLRSYRLKGSIAVPQSRPDQFSAERVLLHDHPEIEQTIMIKVDHFEFVRRRCTDDRRPECKISVARKYTHSI